MEEKILKKTAIFILAVSIVVCASVSYFPDLGTASEELFAAIKEYQTKAQAEKQNMTGLELMEYNNRQAEEESGGEPLFLSQIRLELPLGVTGSDLEITEDYVTRTIDIKIPFAGEEYFYEYPVLGSGDHIDSLTYEYQQKYGIVEFVTDQVFEIDVSYDEDYIYMDFLTLQELYDKVVVIDAGYGGDSFGTTKQGICEKDINLAIVLKLKEIFDTSKDTSIGVFYTRTTDENPSLENRVGLANITNADLFISVCNNSTQSGKMSSINGTQVMYAETGQGSEMGSKELAQICLEEVTALTGSSNKGLVAGSDNFILGNSNVPAALIEVGFMTNQEELGNLCSGEYQSKAAQGIYNAIMRALEEGY